MKNSIKTMLDSLVHDNASFIKENGGDAAEYILTNSEAEDHGWFWFLTDEEIKEFENDNAKRDEHIQEIKDYVNSNYSLSEEDIRINDLVEKYIVVTFDADTEDRIRITKREHFEKVNFCDCYAQYGNKVGCYDAGCYSFDNSGSSIAEDFYAAISEKIGPFGSLMDDLELTNSDLVDWLSDNEDSVAYKTGLENFPDWIKMVSFLKKWKQENETHTEVTAWTYHDSHNFKTVVLDTQFGVSDCVELDEEETRAILAEYPGFPHIEGTNASAETENYIYSFDLWATNPWICFVDKK